MENLNICNKYINNFKYNNYSIINILSFLNDKELSLTILNVNRKYKEYTLDYFKNKYRNENAISRKIIKYCVSDLKPFLSNINNFNKIIANHSENLEKELKLIIDKYNSFIFYRSILISSTIIYYKLLSLDLSQMNIGYDGIMIISNLIKHSKTLTNLFLGYNNINDDGCSFLNNSLSYNNSIVTINLECNAISNIGFEFISDTLISMNNLKNIKMSLNLITNECLKSFILKLDKRINNPFNLLEFKYNNILLVDDNIEMFKQAKIIV